MYTFRISIGDTSTDNFNNSKQKVTVWIIFVLCALVTNIIMLNLLIALISESFNKINSDKMSANYQERARLISENTYLIPLSRLHEFNDKKESKYIIVAGETEEL